MTLLESHRHAGPAGGLTAAALAAVSSHRGIDDLLPLVAGRPRAEVEAEVAAALHRLRIAAREGHLSPGDHERAAVLLELLVDQSTSWGSDVRAARR